MELRLDLISGDNLESGLSDSPYRFGLRHMSITSLEAAGIERLCMASCCLHRHWHFGKIDTTQDLGRNAGSLLGNLTRILVSLDWLHDYIRDASKSEHVELGILERAF